MHPKINLLLIGSQKAGSTALYDLLCQSSEITSTSFKEPSIFINAESMENLNMYGFQNQNLSKYFIDASTSYSSPSFSKIVAPKIYDYNSGAKIIYILRDPIKRAHSAWFYNKRDCVEKYDFSTAIRMDADKRDPLHRLDPFTYVERGFYEDIITNYLEYFPKKQVHVLGFEDLINNHEEELVKLEEFLEIRLARDLTVSNPASLPKSKLLYKFLNHPNPIINLSKNVSRHLLSDHHRDTVRMLYRRLNSTNLQETKKESLSDSDIRFLKHFYDPRKVHLTRKYKIDTSSWL